MYSGQRTIFDFPGKAKSEVWKNFGFYMSDDGYTLDRSKAICKYCRISVRYTGNTTNLHTHFVNHHLRQDKNKASQPTITYFESEVNPSQQPLSDIVRMPVSIPITLPTKEVSKTTPLTHAVMEYFIGDLIPLATINSPSFQKLVYTLDKNCELPSQKQLEEMMMPTLYSEGVDKLVNRLEILESVTLTMDIWSHSHRYMTISANFISAQWHLNTFVLETVPLPQEFEYQYIDQTFQNLEKKWRVHCDPILVSGDVDVLKAGDEHKWTHLSCFAETINNAAIKGLGQPEVQFVIASIRRLFYFFKNGPGSLFNQRIIDQNALIVDVEDRWLSTFNMIQKAVEYLPAMEAILDEHGYKNNATFGLTFDPTSRMICHDLVELLKPLSNASMLLCDQQIASASLILPVLKKLEMTIMEYESTNSAIKECRNVIWKEIQTPYSSESTRDFLLVCSLLDPRYKGLRYVEPVEREKARRLLYDEALKPFIPEVQVKKEVDDDEYIQNIILGQPFSLTGGSGSTSSESGYEEPAKKRKIVPSTSKSDCDWLSDVVGHKEDAVLDSMSPMELLSAEMDRYMKEKQIMSRSPLTWWYEREKIFPNLSQLARKYMGVMGCCKPPEQVFLQEKDALRFQRSAIQGRHLNELIFLNKIYQNLKNSD